MPPRRRLVPRSPDLRSLAEALALPGGTWSSIGIVDADEISFEEGLGPLVPVTLQPSQVQVFCRVASPVAGDGEAEYYPFVAGDEVLVAIPGGNERSGTCVIIGRLNNERAPFPMGPVAGQDPTTNSFAFRRTRTPLLTENGGPWTVRQETGALLSLDMAGAVTIRDGAGDALQMTGDVFAYQSADATALLQLNVTEGRFTLKVNDSLLTLSKGGASPEVNALAVPGTFMVTTLANPAAEHVLTTEAMCNVLVSTMQALSVAISALPGALTGPGLAAVFQTAGFSAALAAGITAAAVGSTPELVNTAILAAFAGATKKPDPDSETGQQHNPGVGCAGFLTG
jgi:hypothetical protein